MRAAVGIVDIDTLTRNWWVFLIRGLVGIVFGVITFFQPGSLARRARPAVWRIRIRGQGTSRS